MDFAGCRKSRSAVVEGIAMGDSFDDIIDGIQKQVFDEAIEAFGEKGFQRWRNPRFNGRMENPDAHARLTGSCGDSIEIFLRFKDNRVCRASYYTDGCGSSQVCASFAAELAIGRNPEELTEITGEAVLKEIGKFPKDEEHCAFLASSTLQEALNVYMKTQMKKNE